MAERGTERGGKGKEGKGGEERKGEGEKLLTALPCWIGYAKIIMEQNLHY